MRGEGGLASDVDVDVADVDGVHVRRKQRLQPMQHRQQGLPLRGDYDDDVLVVEDYFVGFEGGQLRLVRQLKRPPWLKRQARVQDVVGKWGRTLDKLSATMAWGWMAERGLSDLDHASWADSNLDEVCPQKIPSTGSKMVMRQTLAKLE